MKKIYIFLFLIIPTISFSQYVSGFDTIAKGRETVSYETLEIGLFLGGNTEVVKDTVSFTQNITSGVTYSLSILYRDLDKYDFGPIYGGFISVNRANLNIPGKTSITMTSYSFQALLGVGTSKIVGGIIFGSNIPDVKRFINSYMMGGFAKIDIELIPDNLLLGLSTQFGFKTNNQFFNLGSDFYGIMGISVSKVFKL